jgi:hypothetical protein
MLVIRASAKFIGRPAASAEAKNTHALAACTSLASNDPA